MPTCSPSRDNCYERKPFTGRNLSRRYTQIRCVWPRITRIGHEWECISFVSYSCDSWLNVFRFICVYLRSSAAQFSLHRVLCGRFFTTRAASLWGNYSHRRRASRSDAATAFARIPDGSRRSTTCASPSSGFSFGATIRTEDAHRVAMRLLPSRRTWHGSRRSTTCASAASEKPCEDSHRAAKRSSHCGRTHKRWTTNQNSDSPSAGGVHWRPRWS